MIEVLSVGVGASFQDLGRYGFRKLGIPLAGAMDQLAVKFANEKLGNEPNSAVIEFALKGPILKFHSPARICIAGAHFPPIVNEQSRHINEIIEIKTGDILKFGHSPTGVYSYIAIQGGFLTNRFLGSQSYYKDISNANLLKRGDHLQGAKTSSNQLIPQSLLYPYQTSNEIEVSTGPDYHLLNETAQNALIRNEVCVSNEISRMGYRLDIENNLPIQEVLSVPVQPGTIQLTPGGKLLALMRDAQTTGGYARILQLSELGISQLAQKRPGQKFKFVLTEH